MSLDLSTLTAMVERDAAFRGCATLHPIGDDGDKIFPPTHAVDEKKLRPEDRAGSKYAWEKRRINGVELDCVLLDSVQSQANRMEEALQRLWRTRQIALPVIPIDFGPKYPDLNTTTSLTVPHRIADALLRDSILGNELFRHSALGKQFVGATLADVSGLFKTCPTALLFGLWDSTGPTGTGLRIARSLTSEIIGIGAVRGMKTASRIDPTGIQRTAGVLYRARDPDEQWTLDPTRAVVKEKKRATDPDEYALYKEGRPSSAILGNIAPSLDLVAGGVTIDYANQIVVLSLSGLRRMAFGSASEEDDRKARAVLAALGIVAVLASVETSGYFLRSRCQLSPVEGRSLAFKCIASDGVQSAVAINLKEALALYAAAVTALPEHLQWHPWDVEKNDWSGSALANGDPIATLRPAPKLLALIDKSRELGGAADEEESPLDATTAA